CTRAICIPHARPDRTRFPPARRRVRGTLASMRRRFDRSRRSFLEAAVAVPLAASFAPGRAQSRAIPVGLELYSVRDELAKDLMGTLRRVAGMGYQVVEFYAPYAEWTTAQAKEVRALLDELGITCRSTHNPPRSLEAS